MLYFNGITDGVKDLAYRLIGHRGFVESVRVDRGGEDALHGLPVLRERISALGLAAAQQATGAVWSRVIPVTVALAYGDNATVTHVNWDDEDLAFVSRDCAFA